MPELFGHEATVLEPSTIRQIKNALQLALALSRKEGVPLSERHLNETVKLTAAAFEPTETEVSSSSAPQPGAVANDNKAASGSWFSSFARTKKSS